MTFYDLEQLIGHAAALNLVAEMGGVEVYIPRDPKPTSPVTQAVGMDMARILGREMGGERIEVPKARAQLRAPTLAAVARGEISQRKAALLLGLTERQIRNIIGGRVMDERQARLFEDL